MPPFFSTTCTTSMEFQQNSFNAKVALYRTHYAKAISGRFCSIASTPGRVLAPFDISGPLLRLRLARFGSLSTAHNSQSRSHPRHHAAAIGVTQTTEEAMSLADILSRYGITNRPDLRVATVQEGGLLWLVDIHGPGDPVKAISPKRAAELSVELRNAGDEELGRQIAMAAEKAEKANRSTK